MVLTALSEVRVLWMVGFPIHTPSLGSEQMAKCLYCLCLLFSIKTSIFASLLVEIYLVHGGFGQRQIDTT